MSSSIDFILKRKLSHTEYQHVRKYIENLEHIAQKTALIVTGLIDPLKRHETAMIYPMHEVQEVQEEMSDGTIEEEEIDIADTDSENGWKLHHN